VCALEQAMIDTCAHYGVTAARDSINPGVWVGENKIGAVGIRILNKVTKHGLAFNVTNSLETFQTIVPCGLRGRGVTSLEREILGTIRKENPPQNVVYSEVEKILAEQVLKLVIK
jgi:lipoate-protein ligase B